MYANPRALNCMYILAAISTCTHLMQHGLFRQFLVALLNGVFLILEPRQLT